MISSNTLRIAMLSLLASMCASCKQEKCVPDVPLSVVERPSTSILSPLAARDLTTPCQLVVSLSEPVLVDRGLWLVITVSSKISESLAVQSMEAIQDQFNLDWIDDDDQSLLTLVDGRGSVVRYQMPYKPCAAYKPKNAGWIRMPFSHFNPRDLRDPIRVTKTADAWIHVQSRISIRLMDRSAEPPNMASLNPDALWSELIEVPDVCIVEDFVPVITWADEPKPKK